MTNNTTKKIAELNDRCRTAMGVAGRLVQTSGISALPAADQSAIREKVENFEAFTEDNDPHGEHDFGAFEHDGERIFWKIDYYDPTLNFGSEDPSDPKQTVRVLTIMLASESSPLPAPVSGLARAYRLLGSRRDAPGAAKIGPCGIAPSIRDWIWLMDYEFKWLPGTMVPAELAAELAALYSDQYGSWSKQSTRNPGGPIRLSPTRIQKLLLPKAAKLAYALFDGRVIGYAIAIQEKVPDYGVISWVTQLVVHVDHRQKNVGKRLLFAIWKFTDHYAWGLLTANPYAIRALEKATRRRCQPSRIARNYRKLRTFALANVEYVQASTDTEVKKNVARINTDFPIDHSNLDAMLASVTTDSVPWLMGPLEEGWEWFAFTFRDQSMLSLAPEEIEEMLKSSDQVTKVAYSRMLLNKEHRWAQFAEPEAQFIASLPGLSPPSTSVLDFGCGTGRHAVEFAALGFNVTAIDYLDNLIERAREAARRKGVASVHFDIADCRSVELGRKFDLVVCLYDVIGSYAEQSENARILSNISRHLRPGGTAILSVMNLEVTERKAKYFFTLAREPDKLLGLKPSPTMEQTGNIFDPDHYMLDTETQVVYRKEQFSEGDSLPEELILRDRRYRRVEIEAMCKEAGLEVQWSRFVRAGRWAEALDHGDDRAKEILVYCKKL